MAEVIEFPTSVVRSWNEFEPSLRTCLQGTNASAAMEARVVSRMKEHYYELHRALPGPIATTLSDDQYELVEAFLKTMSLRLMVRALVLLFGVEQELYRATNPARPTRA